MSPEHIILIKRWAATGLQTHEVHRIYFPDLELWEVHNAIYFEGRCRTEGELTGQIMQEFPDLRIGCKRLCHSVSYGISTLIQLHEQKLTEMKFRASVAYHNKSRSFGSRD
jgi:hypothetical protein